LPQQSAMAMHKPGRWVLAGESPALTPGHADGRLPPASSALRAAPPVDGPPSNTSPEDLLLLYLALIDADDRSDPAALARIGWQLFSLAGAAEQARDETSGLLSELRAASRAAVAGRGSPGALALLRDVLARHGWLPPSGATPLQMLAAPAPPGPSRR
jgi:hypothetical protein